MRVSHRNDFINLKILKTNTLEFNVKRFCTLTFLEIFPTTSTLSVPTISTRKTETIFK